MRKRAGLAALLAVAVSAAVLGGPSGSTAYASETTGAADAAEAAELRVGTYNIQVGRPLAGFREGIAALKARVDVAGLQEIAGSDRMAVLTEDEDWEVYRPPTLKQVPVVWDRSAFVLLGGRESLLAEGRHVEDTVSGMTWKKTTYAAVVRLRHRATQQRISVVNVHLLNGATRSGLPRPGVPLRHDYYVEQTRSLKHLAAEETAAGFEVFVTGDFNINLAADAEVQRRRHPFRRFASVGMTSVWQGRRLFAHGTHIDPVCRPGVQVCGAYMDGVWSRLPSTDGEVLTDVEQSDHYPAVATYLVPAA
ncbi:MAG: hypothetical protein AVDCRST_MAG36-1277 [uncultured Nocardioidaceae bacterium]|uniref:Endonuclease/exonuclease/phosphatase domain-containing protein n=1 Tax=uncultured Nocardioidaceae bacterium TaxID=253824 RepID=A0A6J4LP93_9ACTN|nr:MAG: hypothetical protein AVDCRST_MAG36-1277 [uncultured Nocardioidaceae bacterium]